MILTTTVKVSGTPKTVHAKVSTVPIQRNVSGALIGSISESAAVEAALARQRAALVRPHVPSTFGFVDNRILEKHPHPKHITYPLFPPSCECGLHLQPWGQLMFDYCKSGLSLADSILRVKKDYLTSGILAMRDCCSSKMQCVLDNSDFHRTYQELARQSSSEGYQLYRVKLGKRQVENTVVQQSSNLSVPVPAHVQVADSSSVASAAPINRAWIGGILANEE